MGISADQEVVGTGGILVKLYESVLQNPLGDGPSSYQIMTFAL